MVVAHVNIGCQGKLEYLVLFTNSKFATQIYQSKTLKKLYGCYAPSYCQTPPFWTKISLHHMNLLSNTVVLTPTRIISAASS